MLASGIKACSIQHGFGSPYLESIFMRRRLGCPVCLHRCASSPCALLSWSQGIKYPLKSLWLLQSLPSSTSTIFSKLLANQFLDSVWIGIMQSGSIRSIFRVISSCETCPEAWNRLSNEGLYLLPPFLSKKNPPGFILKRSSQRRNLLKLYSTFWG